jgi:predicted alpha/beta hydrolase family esterase
MKKKLQIFMVHGGMTFKNDRGYLRYLKTKRIKIQKKVSWATDYLDKELGKKFEIIRPRMPLQDNARYRDWEVYFKRHIPYLKDNIILIGSSLGGIFLAKYLSEHKFSKKILAVFLVCPPFDNTVVGEDLANGFKLKSNLSLLEKNSKNLYLMFSKDDDCVPVSHAEKYRNKLKNANVIIYKSKNGHFNISKFPEIVKMIKNLISN